MTDCIFCKIAKGEIPVEKVLETETMLVFPDRSPKAPVHFLIIPKEHYQDLADLPQELLKDLKEVPLTLLKEHNLEGFRLVNNFGVNQQVKHFHLHFLANMKGQDIALGL